MKKFFAMIVVIVATVFIYPIINDHSVDPQSVDEPEQEPTTEVFSNQYDQQSSTVEDRSFLDWRGAPTEEVIANLGEPTSREKSGFGYEWWTFENGKSEYIQLGVQDNTVVTGVAFNSNATDSMVTIGDDYHDLKDEYTFESRIELVNDGNFILELTENDIKERPLIKLDDHWMAQLYFDTVTNKLSAIRMVRNDILLKLQPYRIEYRGKLPRNILLNDNDWEEIQQGLERQIFTMTNFLRLKYGMNKLSLHETASTVAFKHSKDMNDHNYFSHYSQNGDGLKQRLEEVNYSTAGENIAAQHIDAVAAVHGWLNSQGHRETMFDDQYTHIGIGVHHRYYTQNYLAIQ